MPQLLKKACTDMLAIVPVTCKPTQSQLVDSVPHGTRTLSPSEAQPKQVLNPQSIVAFIETINVC